MSSDPDGTIREILGKILDKTEETGREVKEIERRLLQALDEQRRDSREEVRAIYDRMRDIEASLIKPEERRYLESRIRDLERESVRNDERVKAVAGKVSASVALATALLVAGLRYFLAKI
jgi:hypothetical protein